MEKCSEFSGLLEGGLHGEQLRLQRDAKHLMSGGCAPAVERDCRTGSDPHPDPWQLGRSPQAPSSGVLRWAARREGEREGWAALRGAAGHKNEAAREAWEDDDNKTPDSPFVEKSLGVTDALGELLLRDGVDGRCKVTLQSENLGSAQTHGEGWA